MRQLFPNGWGVRICGVEAGHKTWSWGPVHDPALRGSEFNGFAGKDCELFWSTGVLDSLKIPNNKSQVPNKSQWPKLSALRLDSPPCGRVPSFKILNLFFVLVIEYWNLRFVCNLVLGVWDFITPSIQQTAARGERPLKPSRGQQKGGSYGLGFSVFSIDNKSSGITLPQR